MSRNAHIMENGERSFDQNVCSAMDAMGEERVALEKRRGSLSL